MTMQLASIYQVLNYKLKIETKNSETLDINLVLYNRLYKFIQQIYCSFSIQLVNFLKL